MDNNNMDNYNSEYQNGAENYQNGDNNQDGYQNTYDANSYQNPNYQSYQNPNYQPYQNNYYNNGNYQMPYQQNAPLDLEEPMKVSEWLISLLITMIPCVGLIMIFVWAFGSTEKKSKSNFFKAALIWIGILAVVWLMSMILLVALGIAVGY
ncbi:MAG: hypothetical protein NC231_11685 [Bacillus sp. (in: Bacteria)]|nr:hypothetical protein [Bacillus sp. (in: firmicutes)]MCM1425185.1 hypothetical protein [Eubacterium sp.]